jgi:hypothetical protein
LEVPQRRQYEKGCLLGLFEMMVDFFRDLDIWIGFFPYIG